MVCLDTNLILGPEGMQCIVNNLTLPFGHSHMQTGQACRYDKAIDEIGGGFKWTAIQDKSEWK